MKLSTFICLLVICVLSLEKCFFKFFAQFLIGLFLLLLLRFRRSLNILNMYLLVRYMIGKYFLPFYNCLFTLLMHTFKLKCSLIYFFVVAYVSMSYSWNLYQIQYHEAFILCFLLGVSWFYLSHLSQLTFSKNHLDFWW